MVEGEAAQRFASLDDDELTKLLDGKDSQNTKKVISVSRKVLHDYLHEKDGQFKSIADMDDAPVEEAVKTPRAIVGSRVTINLLFPSFPDNKCILFHHFKAIYQFPKHIIFLVKIVANAALIYVLKCCGSRNFLIFGNFWYPSR